MWSIGLARSSSDCYWEGMRRCPSKDSSGSKSDVDPRTQLHDAPRHVEIGPLLYLRGQCDGRTHLSAIFITERDTAPDLITDEGRAIPSTIYECEQKRVVRYKFSLETCADASYELDGQRFYVNTALGGDLRIAFVSCNGQESGNHRRDLDERNAMWRRLALQHEEGSFQLLIHGGDQIYADELLDRHPLLRKWADEGGKRSYRPSEAECDDLRATLRRAFMDCYTETLSAAESCWLMGRVPSVAMWDDHDICDGWGSMPAGKLNAPVGRLLFEVARESFLVFQFGVAPDEMPEIVVDRSASNLTWHVKLPGLHLIAPDLRSERRWDRVMADTGWQALTTALSAVDEGRVLLISSVPALGPRLSWIEALMHLLPDMHKYEDDLRDQWQSRAHRAEWRRLLEGVAKVHADPRTPVTVLSGEIHLATRAILDVPPTPIHQLVASGISHPAPTIFYALALDLLARFGETPLPGHEIRMCPLPGRTAIYTSQRNFLLLERRSGRWTACWELERSGRSPPVEI